MSSRPLIETFHRSQTLTKTAANYFDDVQVVCEDWTQVVPDVSPAQELDDDFPPIVSADWTVVENS